MNVFVLNSGRCGSTTFVKACQHISNYSSAHESLSGQILAARLNYPDYHIEADNRLCWFLGRLDKHYGDQATYIHLSRNQQDTIDSFVKRTDFGIMKAYREGVLLNANSSISNQALVADYLETIETNIALFLKDKSRVMSFSMENGKQDFEIFWQYIQAEGDLQKAIAEWDVVYNASR